METLAFIGVACMGALLVVLAALGFAAYLCRGHRLDLTRLRVVSRYDEERTGRVLGSLGPEPKTPDYYTQSRERGDE